LTSENEWNPYSSTFHEEEQKMDRYRTTSVLTTSSEDIINKRVIAMQMQEVKTKAKGLFVSHEELSKRWAVPEVIAQETIKVTTQTFIRNAQLPVERRYRTKNVMLKYNRLKCRMYSDTFFSNITSIHGHKCGQLFTTDFGYNKFVPMSNKSEAGYALQEMIREVGIPNHIHTDGAKELTQGRWKEICRDANIHTTQTERDSPWQNRTEIEIRELKRHVRRFMARTNTPGILWDYCCQYTAELRNYLARPLPQLRGRTPHEIITGNTPDISEFLEFTWYEPVWYLEPSPFPQQVKKMARWIGVAHRVGQAMCFWLLPASGVPIARTTIEKIKSDDMMTDMVKHQVEQLDQALESNLKANNQESFLLYRYDLYDLDIEDDELIQPDASIPNTEEIEVDTYDELLLVEPLLEKDGELIRAKITGRKRDSHGNLVGNYNANPLLNTRVYIAEFPDGYIAEYNANKIAEAIYDNVDDNGLDELLFEAIVGHERLPETEPKQNTLNKHVTGGWNICIMWKDGTSSWHTLADVKNSYPLQLANYAIQNGLEKEAAFSWWVKPTIKHKRAFIKAAKRRFAKRTHKFGIRVPQTVEEALNIDKETKTTFWRDAIHKEMKNNRMAFQFLEDEQPVPVGYTWIKCHMIFDVKMDFTRKARYVAGGHMTDPPSSITYASVVSRDSVRIAFMIAALNDIDILACDIGNAYLNATPREKVYTTAGPEFGHELEGRRVIIVRALYGLKSSGAAWRSHLSNTLQHLGYTSSLADPDVWFRPAKKSNGFEYYEYVLVYVDDLLVLSHQADITMKLLEDFYRLKDGYAKPDRYLGAQVKEWRFPDDTVKPVWAISSEQYVKEAIRNVENNLQRQNRKLPKVYQPLPSNYHPELDITPLLTDDEVNLYQSYVSILRWIVELGRLDIYVHVAFMSAYLSNPRVGNMEAILYIFGYLKAHDRSTMVFDPGYLQWKDSDFLECDWTDFYPNASEEIPSKAPPSRGLPVQINCFVDANHAGNKLNRRSHSGILIYLNRSPTVWYSKSQKTVETSTFGSEFVALRIATELIKALRYKLRMFGIPIQGPANVLIDNETVMKNTSIPSSTLQKKHNAICYHYVREAVAAKVMRIAHIPTDQNLADMFTKVLGATKLKGFVQKILY